MDDTQATGRSPKSLAAVGMLIPDGPPKYDAEGNLIKPPWHNLVAVVNEEAEAVEQAEQAALIAREERIMRGPNNQGPRSVEWRIEDRRNIEAAESYVLNERSRQIVESAVGRSEFDLPPSLGQVMGLALTAGIPMLYNEDGKPMLRRGDTPRLVGVEKAGKTEAASSLAWSMITGERFLGFYEPVQFADDEVWIHVDAENAWHDVQIQMGPLAARMTAAQRERLIIIPALEWDLRLLTEASRDLIHEKLMKVLDGRRVGGMSLDSLGSLSGFDNKALLDPFSALTWRDNVVRWSMRPTSEGGLGSAMTLSLMHAPRGMAKEGTNMKPYGGPHWDQQMSPHWVYTTHPDYGHRGPRLFEVTASRGGLSARVQLVTKDPDTDVLKVDTSREDEAKRTVITEDPKAKRDAARAARTREVVLRCLPDSTAETKDCASANSLVAPVKAMNRADGCAPAEVHADRQRGIGPALVTLVKFGQAEAVRYNGNTLFRRTASGDRAAAAAEDGSADQDWSLLVMKSEGGAGL